MNFNLVLDGGTQSLRFSSSLDDTNWNPAVQRGDSGIIWDLGKMVIRKG